MEELFGPVLGKRPTPATLPPKEEATERPAKAGKPNAGGKGRGAGSQGQGSRGRNQRSQGSGASGQQQQGSQKGQISKDTLKLVTRILMHQQESISTLRLSTGWVWWLRIPEPSPIAMMIQAAQVWREEVVKPDSPHRETPIRQAIFWSLIQYLKLAIQNLGEEGLKEAKASGWALENGDWVFQRWCPEQKCLVMDSRHKALPQKELLPLIQGVQDHIHRETLSRFHATKKLEEGMEGETVRLFMDVAFRAPEANALFEKLSQLQGSAALQVAGIQFRRESLQRPPALQQLMALSWGP